MSSPGGMCEQGSGMSRNQLFLSLFAIKWTVQEIVLRSVNFQFSWITINTQTKLVACCRLLPSFLSPQACSWPCWHPGIPAPWRSYAPTAAPLPQKVSKGLKRSSDGSGFLLSASPVCTCALIPSLLSLHPFLGADGFCRAVLDISMASALHGWFHSLICQCKQQSLFGKADAQIKSSWATPSPEVRLCFLQSEIC